MWLKVTVNMKQTLENRSTSKSKNNSYAAVGKHKLRLWLGKEADGSVHTTTPGKVPKKERGELERLEKLVNKYERRQIQRVNWLDRLAFKAMVKIKDLRSSKNGSSHLYVLVNFSSFKHRVVLHVRAHAVCVLETADYEELQCYLLQLVQALRWKLQTRTSRNPTYLFQRWFMGQCYLQMCSKQWKKNVTDSNMEQLNAKLQETKDWLYEDGEDETKGV
ncbi:phosphatidylinositol 3-kinase, root isoform [Tanacetum coccineum]|uniref:Phosphatidylinositol 3-kinase, root isoform n=1 Tax=Tanacetum coccineum TaxID=301880 RepID=A0ABQ5F6Y7_9ASTR